MIPRQVPNASVAIVEETKIVNYLLNAAHQDGAPKARFFRALGFATANWQDLAAEFLALIRREPYVLLVESEFGQKYIVDGEIHGPLGSSAAVRSIWISTGPTGPPRLLTAYPRP